MTDVQQKVLDIHLSNPKLDLKILSKKTSVKVGYIKSILSKYYKKKIYNIKSIPTLKD